MHQVTLQANYLKALDHLLDIALNQDVDEAGTEKAKEAIAKLSADFINVNMADLEQRTTQVIRFVDEMAEVIDMIAPPAGDNSDLADTVNDLSTIVDEVMDAFDLEF